MNILIRCDGSAENGPGHISKYLAFADKLKAIKSCAITFAMRKSKLCITQVKEKYPVLTPHMDNEKFDDQEWLCNLIRFAGADILILDSKDAIAPATLERIKKTIKIKILVADIGVCEEKTEFEAIQKGNP